MLPFHGILSFHLQVDYGSYDREMGERERNFGAEMGSKFAYFLQALAVPALEQVSLTCETYRTRGGSTGSENARAIASLDRFLNRPKTHPLRRLELRLSVGPQNHFPDSVAQLVASQRQMEYLYVSRRYSNTDDDLAIDGILEAVQATTVR
ncbi:hypothetical protein BDV98DRAFT_54316 [Pterulicium gracile]|uniref:Uncharacterized protein n=1 Tax=Pterulicium gracile TaxID=1884261 RepID=A0A5C3QK86_9AGAR|nr:hypothetical protein BDV98DRAFT_54316 [Pterula gracilis]